MISFTGKNHFNQIYFLPNLSPSGLDDQIIRVRFPSLVKIGDSVPMRCQWSRNNDTKQVTWYRQTQNSPSPVQILSSNITSQTLASESAFEERIMSLHQDSYESFINVTLQGVTENDSGRYWCNVTILNAEYSSNRDTTLEVIGRYTN